MLSRTANDLYWMSRHTERAENTARMLDVTYRMSLLPYRMMAPGEKWAEPWALPLIITGLATSYYQRYSELSPENVLHFMVLDASNSNSIYASLQIARENARAQRGAITIEMWETLNQTWLEMRGKSFADITARVLDAKYHTLLPSVDDVGGAVDYYQWSALLRSVSAFSSYRKIYRDVITPLRVAELMILRDDVPRSLHHCMNAIYEILQALCDEDRLEPERLAGEIHAQLHYGKTERIFKVGLHEYLLAFLEEIGALNSELNKHFLMPTYA